MTAIINGLVTSFFAITKGRRIDIPVIREFESKKLTSKVSLRRAKPRSNPSAIDGATDCFAALAMTRQISVEDNPRFTVPTEWLKWFNPFCYNLAMIIDFHTHVFPPKIIKDRQQYADSDPCFALLYSNPKARLVSAQELIDNMDKEGIDISVVLNIGWITHEMCVETNDYILESVARYPRRLVGFCAIQPNSPEAAAREIERCAKAGAKGVGEMRPDMQMFEFHDEQVMPPFAEALKKHDMMLLTHASEPVGHYYQGKGSITPEALYPLITGYPDLKVVFAHWGGGLPFYVLMPEVKKALANAYFDTAASPFLYSPQVYSQVMQLVGADKVLFGSDYPLLSPTRLLDEIHAQNMPQDTRELILSGNARRLLGLR